MTLRPRPPQTVLLRARVHLDAFRSQPLAYLQGVLWRARGLKLRARHRFSALMGHSPRAYALWIASREPSARARALQGPPPPRTRPTIVIDCRQGIAGLDASLASVAAAGAVGEVVLLGQPAIGIAHERVGHVCGGVGELGQVIQALCRTNPWVIAMEPGDLLDPMAPALYDAARIARGDAALFYADDDLVDRSGHRGSPHFKPGWNAELARHVDFVSNACMFRCAWERIDEGWPASACSANGAAVHVPHVLHHRRARPAAPCLPAVPEVAAADLPHVTIIIPTRDQAALLKTCIRGVLDTRYPAFDVIVIDNDTTDAEALSYLHHLQSLGVRVHRQPGPFNYARMHNETIGALRCGPMLCLLNNDIEILDRDWLRCLVVGALRDDVGAVGAKLLYPTGTIQHAGIVTGVGGGAGHAHRFQPDGAPGYFLRAHLPQFVSAVTGACLVVAKDRFEAVGGFDAENFAVAFNDVDLCLKLNARGWQSLYEPRAILVHHESESRGNDLRGAKKARFAGELAALKRIWATDRNLDPFHHPELSPFSEQFVVRL